MSAAVRVALCSAALAGASLVGVPSPAPAHTPPGPAHVATVPEPDDDPFYEPADGYRDKAPGTVLKQRRVQTTGLGIPLPTRSYQLQVRSTDAKDRPVTVVSTVVVPKTPSAGPRRLLSYQPATDSLGDQCNPSYALRTGTEKEIALIANGLAKGWTVVVTDYQGPRDAYGAGRMEGHAVLDGVRATIATPQAELSGRRTPVGLWGYSGGGLATGWAAQLQPSYAPELNIAGVASGGTPADLEAAGRLLDGGPFAGLFLGAAVGVSREYPELTEILNEEGRELVEEIGDKCVAGLAAGYAFRSIKSYSDSPDPLSEPIAQRVLGLNRMGGRAPGAPVYLYHSRWDELIPYRSATELRSDWCTAGGTVTLHTDYLSEHNSLAVSGAPAALAYLSDRFAERAAPDDC